MYGDENFLRLLDIQELEMRKMNNKTELAKK